MTKLLSVTEAAELMNVHPNTILNQLRDGTLPGVKTSDKGHWRIRKADLPLRPDSEAKRLRAALASLIEAASRFADYQDQNWNDLQDRREWEQFTAAIETARRSLDSGPDRT